MIAAFRELKQTETILLVEQNFSFVCALGDTVAVMDGGRIVPFRRHGRSGRRPGTAAQAARPVAGFPSIG
jgi:ABC-type branched-subunit amino acid transport system ATPase component